LLSACINGKISLPKRNGHFFLDRNSNDFKLILYYLKKSKIPKFQNLMEEKDFFKEMDFWKIPILVIDPQIPAGLEWVKVSMQTPYGTVAVQRKGRKLQVELPAGVTATIGGREYDSGSWRIAI
ncbi:MAG: hypothetical protein IIT92_04735, partial [Bacteroidales bacterium]|nr:hypothetical protein [Bacteroidales bacterium]